MLKKPFKIIGIEHVGIAVKSLDGVSDIFSGILGLDHVGEEEVSDQGVLTDIYDTGGGKLEFLKGNFDQAGILIASLNSKHKEICKEISKIIK